jgi:hypothetical protein
MNSKLGFAIAGVVAAALVVGCAGSDEPTDEEKTEQTSATSQAYVGCGGYCWWASPGTKRQSSCGHTYTCGYDHMWHPDNGQCNGGGCYITGGGSD